MSLTGQLTRARIQAWKMFQIKIGGAIVPIVVGLIVGATGSYYWVLMLFVALAVALGVLPALIKYNKKIGME